MIDVHYRVLELLLEHGSISTNAVYITGETITRTNVDGNLRGHIGARKRWEGPRGTEQTNTGPGRVFIASWLWRDYAINFSLPLLAFCNKAVLGRARGQMLLYVMGAIRPIYNIRHSGEYIYATG